MGSSYNSETQLLAIYRLEFYKNKKKWKLCEDVVKESDSPSPRTHSKLNETYNVDDVELVSPHNKAFLHQEPGELQGWHDEAPEPQECELEELAGEHCQCGQSCAEQLWPADQSELLWQDALQEWCGAEGEPGRACPRAAWPEGSQYEQLKAECEPPDPPPPPPSPAHVLRAAQCWLRARGCATPPAPACRCPAEEGAEFVRGAHHAPHSSETELSGASDGGACACALSPRQLARAVRAHCAALARLLAEHALRDRLYRHSPLHPPMPLEEYPTRDTDPLRPPDCVLSGSHRLPAAHWQPDCDLSGSAWVPDSGLSDSAWVPDSGLSNSAWVPDSGLSDSAWVPQCGRGRGRLQQPGRPVIGIGMGRPYRL